MKGPAAFGPDVPHSTPASMLMLHPLADFIEGELLAEQVEAVKKTADLVTQLRRVGLGHGVWAIDRTLGEK